MKDQVRQCVDITVQHHQQNENTDPKSIDLTTTYCIMGGLIGQLRHIQGSAGLEAAKELALTIARSMPSIGSAQPDLETISKIFSQIK